MAMKANDKILLSAKESCPPPGYVGRNNEGFEYDGEPAHGLATVESEVDRKRAGRLTKTDNGNGVATLKKKKVQSICLCTASVYPHYHGETIIDDNVYDEILIIDPKELQATANKNVRLKGQCLRICKLVILIFVILVGLACGLYGVAHYFIQNKGGDAILGYGDVKLLLYSTYFCEGIKTEPSEIQRSLVVLKGDEGKVATFDYNTTSELVLEPGQRIYEQSFYAIKQGEMRITIETKEDVDVLIFDEKTKLDNWKNNKHFAVYNFKRRCCKSITIERGVYSFRTEEDRQAFFVVYSDSSKRVSVNLTLAFERSFVGYSKSDHRCSADVRKSCSVPLSFASSERVVLEIPRISNAFASQKVEWNCEARIWFYFFVFAGIFIAFIILMMIVYCLFRCCFCDPCCCCFCCYIVPQEEKSKPKVVQYHCGTLRHNTNYVMRTPRGPRADQMRNLRRHDSNESIIKHGYTTSDTSDTEAREIDRRREVSRTNSTATTHSMVSHQFSRRRSSGSIGSDIKRGMIVDDSYEELPVTNEDLIDGRRNGFVLMPIDDLENGFVDPRGLRRIKMSRRARREARRQTSNDGSTSDIEARLRMKKAQFSDTDEEEEATSPVKKKADPPNESNTYNRSVKKSQSDDDDDDYDNTYDIVGFQIASPSKSTAEKIDTLPLGPSGAPPNAPPKSAASIKGKPGLKAVKSLENIEILPNGMTRAKGEPLQKSKSDVMKRNGMGRKHSPMTPNVIILNGQRDAYSTYERGRKNQPQANGLYSRTISLDSGLDCIDGSGRPKIKPAADVKF